MLSSELELLKDYALQHVGLPYIWGGDDPIIGFDCSGLVQELLASMGRAPAVDQTAQGLFNLGWPDCDPKLGAVAFYGSAQKITHVALCLDETTIVEAGGGGSKTITAQDAAKQNAYVRLRPVFRRKDFVCCRWPF